MLNETILIVTNVIHNPVLVSFVLGTLPVSEVRGAAIYSFIVGNPGLILPAVISNILVCPIILLFWKALRIQKIGEFILGKSLEKKLLSLSRNYESQGLLALIVFIGLPFPATGVYTGTLIAEILGIDRKKIFLASVLGVLVSASIMYLLLKGFNFWLTS